MKYTHIITIAAIALLSAACNKNETATMPPANAEPIILGAEGAGFSISTKTTEVTSLPSFNLTVTKGSEAAQIAVWNSVPFTKSGNTSPATYSGGKFWPVTNPSYHFYASNVAMNTASASGPTLSASNTTDVVCAMKLNPTFKMKSTLQFEHIFARLGDVVVSPATGYTISNVQITLTPKTGGVYSIYNGYGRSDATGWSELVSGSSTVISGNTCPSTQSNDIYLVPGQYTLTASWKAEIDEYVKEYSNRTVNVDLSKGMINTITATLGGGADEILFSVLVSEWQANSINATFPVN